MFRGQVLSYDALGGGIIFMIAVGILIAYWSALNASFSDEDANMILEANTVIDNLMKPGVLLQEDGYHISLDGSKCDFIKNNRRDFGFVHEFYLEIVDSKGRQVSSCGVPPTTSNKTVVSERLAYYKDPHQDYPVKLVLRVYA